MDTDVELKLKKARIELMLDYPFFGNIALNLQMVEDNSLFPPTMATDGLRLYYHPLFVSSCAKEELIGVIMHEVGHVMFMHMTRIQGREMNRWNKACDFAVNDIIHEEANFGGKIRLPPGGLYSRDFRNKNAEWIYSKLPEEPPPRGGGGNGNGNGNGGTLDSHEPWKNISKGLKDDAGNNISKEELEQKIRNQVASAMTVAKMAGRMPGSIEEMINGVLQPKLDWRLLLRDKIIASVHNNYRLVPPSKKHLWRNIYLPAVTGEELNMAVIIDSSGSISYNQAQECLGEVHGICEAFEDYTIYLFIADTTIQDRYELHPSDPIPRVIKGRGGTSYKPAFETIARENLPINCLVYLTDLYPNDGFPKEPEDFSVIWVSVSDQKDVPWGEVINIPRR